MLKVETMASKKAQCVKNIAATKPYDLSLIFNTHRIKEKDQVPQVVFTPS